MGRGASRALGVALGLVVLAVTLAVAQLARGPRAGAVRDRADASATLHAASPRPVSSATPSPHPSRAPVLAVDPRAPAVCGRTPDCHLEYRADVDGDGLRDDIAIVGHPDCGSDGFCAWCDPKECEDSGSSRPVLRVALRGGPTSFPVTYERYDGHLVLGAANLDGVPGKELLVGFAAGAHGTQQSVLTLRHGRLVPLASPDPWYPEDASPFGSWGADGSITSNVGWHCRGGHRVEEYVAGGDYRPDLPDRIEYTLSHRTWRWTQRGWRATGPEVVHGHQRAPDFTRYVDWTGCGTFSKFRDFVGRPYSAADVSPAAANG